MISRRVLLSATTGAALNYGAGVLASESNLSWRHFPAGAEGFNRAPVLLSGSTEALLIDGGFTFSDAQALIAAIAQSGMNLTAIYVSHSDPDYYFNLKPVLAAYPETKLIAASATVDAIRGNIERKLEVWGPQLKANGPRTIADIVFPEPFDGDKLTLDGHAVEIVTSKPLANRRYLWVPSLRAVLGGALVVAGLHVWIADTPRKDQRAGWIKSLDEIVARNPLVVVPGHGATGSANDLSAVMHTRNYLLAFEEELAKAPNADALKWALISRFPDLAPGASLDISTRVAMGEMEWG